MQDLISCSFHYRRHFNNFTLVVIRKMIEDKSNTMCVEFCVCVCVCYHSCGILNVMYTHTQTHTCTHTQTHTYTHIYVYITMQTGEYVVGWNTKVTPLGYKLISLNAAMNGLSELQQVVM